MVVVYSGDSSRPPPLWEKEEPTAQRDLAEEQPVQRELSARDRPEPFPLATDFVPPDPAPSLEVTPERLSPIHLDDPPAALQTPEFFAPPLNLPEAPASAPAAPAAVFTSAPDPQDSESAEPDAVVSLTRPSARSLASAAPISETRPRAMATRPAPAVREQRPKQAPPAKGRGAWLVTGLGIVAGALAAFGLPSAERPAARVSPLQAEPVPIAAPASIPSVSVNPNPILAGEPPQAPATKAPTPELEAKKQAATPGPSTRTVHLSVFPDDSGVYRRGLVLSGPPYSVEVPASGRITLEVAKPGYVTRRVPLDGTEPNVIVGLTKDPDEVAADVTNEATRAEGSEAEAEAADASRSKPADGSEAKPAETPGDGAVPVLSGL